MNVTEQILPGVLIRNGRVLVTLAFAAFWKDQFRVIFRKVEGIENRKEGGFDVFGVFQG